jgi:parallel beta-helix repeat protein
MKKSTKFYACILVLSLMAIFMNDVKAYTHEVWQSGSLYYWKTFDVQRGSTTSLATAIQNAIETGNREVHILCGGTLSAQINIQPGLTLSCHNNTFNKNHSGYGFFLDGSGPYNIYDMTLNNNTNMGIRSSRASDIRIVNVRINGGSIGIRIDSHPSRPYEDGRWVYNVYIQDCMFEGCSSHGLETYGVDGFGAYGINARYCGECGVLLNKTINGTIGTVNAYRCCYGGGYAGLRFANTCVNITTNMLYADQCGRGYFVLTGSSNCHLNNCQITNSTDVGIWLENVANCSVKAGCCNSGVAVSGSGSYANVGTSSCISYCRIRNRGTGMYLDGMNRTTLGASAGQWANTDHVNAQWTLEAVGSYFKIRNHGTGLYLDGLGYTTNGSIAGQWTSGNSNNQQWERISTDGYWRFKNRATGMFLDGYGRTTNGADVSQYANTTHVNAQWAIDGQLKSAIAEEGAIEPRESNTKIYPKLVENKLNIVLGNGMEEGSTLSIYGITGILVYTDNLVGENSNIDLSNLSKGIYFIKISNGKDVISEKIIKE